MTPEEVLKEIESEARKLGWPIIGPERGKFLDEAVAKHKPERILEVGTLVGYSAIRMARLLDPRGRIVCLELDPARARTAEQNSGRAGFGSMIKVVAGDARKTIPTLKDRFDLVFLDAVKADYLTYLLLAEPLLYRGSVVAADNVKSHEDELRGYLEYVRRSGAYVTEKIGYAPTFDSGVPDAIEISVKV